jgi:hypothetical protein
LPSRVLKQVLILRVQMDREATTTVLVPKPSPTFAETFPLSRSRSLQQNKNLKA